RSPPILAEKGNAAWHDRKSPGDPRHDEATKKIVLDRILAVLLGRTYFVAESDICAPADLDWLTRMALGFRSGLLSLAEELGAERVHALCSEYAAAHPGFAVPKRIADKNLVAFRRNVRVEREGMVGIVRVWRPEVKNALSAQTIAEIDSAFDELAADDAIRGIVFTSYDGSLAGADINELAALPTPADCTAI